MRSGRLVTIVTVFAAAFSVNGPRAGADTVAVNCATGSLQTKIDNASPGTVILVKGTCDGTFVIPRNLTLKGNPTATLDGGSTGATLTVTGTRVIHLRSLVVTGGLGEAGGGIAMADGGGIDVEGGTTFLHGTILAANTGATGPDCIGQFTTEGHNVFGDVTGCV